MMMYSDTSGDWPMLVERVCRLGDLVVEEEEPRPQSRDLVTQLAVVASITVVVVRAVRGWRCACRRTAGDGAP